MAVSNDGWGEWGRYVLEELKRLNACLIDVSKDLTALRMERESKIDGLESGLGKRLKDIESDIGDIEKDVERLKERLKIVSIVQVAFTSVTGAIAGWLGTKG